MVNENIYSFNDFIRHIETLDCSKEQVVIFMLAPYNENKIKEIVDQYYDYWNIRYDRDRLHFYWIGYILASSSKRMRLNVFDDLYFDLKVYNDLIQELNKHWTFHYRDQFEMVIVRTYKQTVDFKNHIRVDLEDMKDLSQLKDMMAYVHEIFEEYQSFYSLKVAIKQKLGLQRLRKIKWDNLLQTLQILCELNK